LKPKRGIFWEKAGPLSGSSAGKIGAPLSAQGCRQFLDDPIGLRKKRGIDLSWKPWSFPQEEHPPQKPGTYRRSKVGGLSSWRGFPLAP